MVDNTMPFASALFDLASEEHKEEAVLSDLKEIRDLFNENREYKLALLSPNITREEKKVWMKELFENSEEEVIGNFMQILAQYNMLGQMDGIYDDYLTLYREQENIEPVKVESAVPLDEAQMEKLTAMLEKKLKKKVELQIKVDPALIAGLRIQTRDKVIDNTLSSRLNSMKEKLNS